MPGEQAVEYVLSALQSHVQVIGTWSWTTT
jgi:hypothetical protein